MSAIGIGQCGCNICDEFYAINEYAKSSFGRGLEILVDAFALNSDETDLASLRHVPRDRRHRMVIGASRTFGHGVGKINIEGAKITKDAEAVIIDNVLSSKKFHESDAVFAVASGAGGTGSGGIGILVKGLKERVEKPIYALVVLPFAYEEKGDTSYAVINTATCLKTVNQYADAVFLVDNERFARADMGISSNLRLINQQMAKNFFDLFCAGEEKKSKYVGSKVVDAGDIKESVEGIGTIGRGEVDISTFYPSKKDDYREAAKQGIGAMGALTQALNNLCVNINPEDARKVLVMVTAPKDAITLNMLSDLSNNLQERAPKAALRMGDYPRRAHEVAVTVILSKLTTVPRMENIFLRAEQLIKNQQEIAIESEKKIKQMYSSSENIPSLDK
ncbi:MAG: hypothetical protein ABIH70_04450 [Chloroflexota bacterium]